MIVRGRLNAPPRRLRFRGVRRVLAFNCPRYAAAVGAGLAALFVAMRSTQPALIAPAWAAVAVLVWFTIASLVAAHVIYDRSPIATGRWLVDALSERPRRWASVHAGFDSYARGAANAMRLTGGDAFDVFDANTMTESSIHRARTADAATHAIPAAASHLPADASSYDLVLVVFAAHEIRRREQREAFFDELKRITTAGGRIIVVEHLRDLANFAVFGPGFTHFLRRREWLRLAARSGLSLDNAAAITPFVARFIFRKPS